TARSPASTPASPPAPCPTAPTDGHRGEGHLLIGQRRPASTAPVAGRLYRHRRLLILEREQEPLGPACELRRVVDLAGGLVRSTVGLDRVVDVIVRVVVPLDLVPSVGRVLDPAEAAEPVFDH